jgi:hypothetical protein
MERARSGRGQNIPKKENPGINDQENNGQGRIIMALVLNYLEMR